jgi:hypothetical protein
MKSVLVCGLGLAIPMLLFQSGCVTGGKSLRNGGQAALIEDQALVVAVLQAASQGVGPNEVELAVKKPADINTLRPYDRYRLKRLPLIPETCREDVSAKFCKAKDVVLWVRPASCEPRRVIGIIYNTDGTCEVFRAGFGMRW